MSEEEAHETDAVYFVRHPNDMWGGGYCLAAPLPTALKRGINIVFDYGGSSYYFAKGKDPYNPTRLMAMMEPADYVAIRTPFVPAIPSTPPYASNHFDNVRLVIDPQAICVPGTSAEVAPPPSSGPGSTEWQNLVALAYDIVDAEDAGLAVILDCHPHVFSPHHYEFLNKGHVADFPSSPHLPPDQCWNYSTTPPTYPGPFKYDMVTNLTGAPPTANHPLLKFWYSFPRNLNSAYSIAKLNRHPEASGDALLLSPSKVFFEIMNEPFQDMQFYYQNETEATQNDVQWRSLSLSTCYPGWRDLQKAAINTVGQWDSRFWCIATTYLSDPRDLSGWGSGFAPQPYGNVYSNSELPANDTKVAYTVHFYEPMRFTHNWFSSPDPSAGFSYNRDWKDFINDENDQVENPYGRDIPENDSQLRICQSGEQMLARITAWKANIANRINNVAPPMLVTEFGSMKQGTSFTLDPSPEDGQTPSFPQENVNNYRYLWTFHTRGNIEASGLGWNVFAYTGSFSTWMANSLWSSLDFQAHGDRGVIKNYMRDALFAKYLMQGP